VRRVATPQISLVFAEGRVSITAQFAVDHRGMANDGDQIALATGFDPQHARSIGNVKNNDASLIEPINATGY
jgi:hypothetical protein